MENFDKEKYNEITYQLTQALLFKVTDALLAIFVESKDRNLILKLYLDADKVSDLDIKLMTDFEAETKIRLPGYEIKFVLYKFKSNEFANNNVLPSYFERESFGTHIFLRFNKLWW